MGWQSEGPCKVCGQKNCYAHCNESEDGKHAYKPGSIVAREDGVGDGYVIVDLNCKNCGQSGSCVLELNEGNINW